MTNSSTLPLASTSNARIASLDQFRGYTIAGMFLVNFWGSFAVTPALLKHHNNYCSYADTIMPQFLFAVGFAFRLTFDRHAKNMGLRAAYLRVARRLGALALLALVLYALDSKLLWDRLAVADFWSALAEFAKRDWFQTLMHIAVTSLWILPVIRAGVVVRVAYLFFSAAANMLLSDWFNFAWINTPPNGIDGGPLGFLTWAIPALVGTLACDAVQNAGRPNLGRMLAWSMVLMAVGYCLSCGTRLYDVPVEQAPTPAKLAESPVLVSSERFRDRDFSSLLAEPPFVSPPPPAERQWNYWMMSQRSGTISYQTFAAGFSLAVFVIFYVACDGLGWQLGLFRTLGTNPLVAYVLGGLLEMVVKWAIPRSASWWHVAAGFAIFFSGTYLVLRMMEKRGVMFRL